MGLLVATSGWMYAGWRQEFYPQAVPKRGWLEYYASHFPALELNNAFYRLPSRETFAAWGPRTSPGFVMSVKASRYLRISEGCAILQSR
jgi:uncharacterized protein YecE (DUF72 family)